jgi:hypothetical protein
MYYVYYDITDMGLRAAHKRPFLRLFGMLSSEGNIYGEYCFISHLKIIGSK